MASYIDKTKITTGLDTNTKLDLSCQHITTSDWMHGSPVYIKEMVPGEDIKIKQETFTRLAPMALPTLGRGLIHNRAFFVPFRTIFKGWNEFISGADVPQPVITGSSEYGTPTGADVVMNSVPILTNKTVYDFFLYSNGTGNGAYVTSYTGTGDAYDIASVYIASGATPVEKKFVLTPRGRRIMKIFQSLGYNFIWNNSVDAEYSALPLLAWCKILIDWYYPSQYVGDTAYNRVAALCNAIATTVSVTPLTITTDDLKWMFSQSADDTFTGLMNYDSDYFVSAFDNPLGPSEGQLGYNQASIEDINYDYSNLTNQSYRGTVGEFTSNVTGFATSRNGGIAYRPAMQLAVTNGGMRITQYGLDALKALTDYVKRHQIAGARAVDRLYARYGKVLDSAKMDRTYYIGSQNIPINFGDVMNHAETQDGTVGEYAGKGLGYGEFNFDYNTDEFGYVIVVSSIIPQVGYVEGVDRMVMHTGRLDFWTPEFDQIGNQAIAKKELYVPMNWDKETASNAYSDWLTEDLNSGIFGYAPRYAEYKCGRDRLTGDFRYGSLNTAGFSSRAWNLFRYIGAGQQDSANMVHNRFFVNGSDYQQYNRIFQSVNSTADKFVLIHNFTVVSNAPMHSLYDTYKFENEDEGAKKVALDVNGVKVN